MVSMSTSIRTIALTLTSMNIATQYDHLESFCAIILLPSVFQYVTNKEKAKQYRNYSLAYFGHMCEQLMSVLISLSSPQECSPWPTLDRTPTAPSSSCAPPRPSGSMASTSSSARFVEIIMTGLVVVNIDDNDGNDEHR